MQMVTFLKGDTILSRVDGYWSARVATERFEQRFIEDLSPESDYPQDGILIGICDPRLPIFLSQLHSILNGTKRSVPLPTHLTTSFARDWKAIWNVNSEEKNGRSNGHHHVKSLTLESRNVLPCGIPRMQVVVHVDRLQLVVTAYRKTADPNHKYLEFQSMRRDCSLETGRLSGKTIIAFPQDPINFQIHSEMAESA